MTDIDKNLFNKLESIAWKELHKINELDLDELNKRIKKISILIELADDINENNTDCKKKLINHLMMLVSRKKKSL